MTETIFLIYVVITYLLQDHMTNTNVARDYPMAGLALWMAWPVTFVIYSLVLIMQYIARERKSEEQQSYTSNSASSSDDQSA